MGLQKDQAVFSANLKLDQFLQRDKHLIHNNFKLLNQELTSQQRIVYGKFRKKLYLSEMHHADMYRDKQEKTVLQDGLQKEMSIDNSELYKRMLHHRSDKLPASLRGKFLGLRAHSAAYERRQMLASRLANRRPQTTQAAAGSITFVTEGEERREEESRNASRSTSAPLVTFQSPDGESHHKSDETSGIIDCNEHKVPGYIEATREEGDPEKNTEKKMENSEPVFITETGLIKANEPEKLTAEIEEETNVLNVREIIDKVSQENQPTQSKTNSSKPPYLGRSVSLRLSNLQSKREEKRELEALKIGRTDLKCGVELMRYPHEECELEDTDWRVTMRMGRYLCKPTQDRGGADHLRETPLCKEHKRLVASAGYPRRITALEAELEQVGKMSTPRDYVGEETLRRVTAARTHQVHEVAPTPDALVRRHCSDLSRVPRSHTMKSLNRNPDRFR